MAQFKFEFNLLMSCFDKFRLICYDTYYSTIIRLNILLNLLIIIYDNLLEFWRERRERKGRRKGKEMEAREGKGERERSAYRNLNLILIQITQKVDNFTITWRFDLFENIR